RARGELFNDATFLLKASMHASLRQTAACAATIQGSGMLDKKRTRKKAQGAMDACKAEKPQD
ncbi:MAG: hypothetical protein KC656_24525, partial [Myxococcales bacterium]|nr:hypothetical protein [Myxococcales bacterium]